MNRRDDDIITISNIYTSILIAIAVSLSMMVILTCEVRSIHENKDCYIKCHNEMIEEKEKASVAHWWGIVWEYELCCRGCEKAVE